MKTVFVDTNVFLRFFVQDLEDQRSKASLLFTKARRAQVKLITGPPVLFEVAWTLRNTYKLDRPQVLEILESIASLPGLDLIDSRVVRAAIGLAKSKGQEFPDSYIAASASLAKVDYVATFNVSHFEKLEMTLYPW